MHSVAYVSSPTTRYVCPHHLHSSCSASRSRLTPARCASTGKSRHAEACTTKCSQRGACVRQFLTLALAGLVDYVVEAGASAEERGLVLARDIAQARPAAAHRS